MFVEHHIKHIATKHESYIEDTPDFLRILCQINQDPKLDDDTMLVTMDVSDLFTNIRHKDGLKAMDEKLKERKEPKVPTELIMKLMEIILEHKDLNSMTLTGNKTLVLLFGGGQYHHMQIYS